MKFFSAYAKRFFYLCFALFLFIKLSNEDLPVHCLKHDIVGQWIIQASALILVKSGHEMKCGHNEPSREETSYTAISPYPMYNKYTLKLNKNNQAELHMKDKILKGKWTMVYDEGFDIQFEDLIMFAFSKYTPDKTHQTKTYKSQCFSTCVGWMKNANGSKWGCYQGSKVGENPDKITSENSKNNVFIIEPDSTPKDIKPQGESLLSSMFNLQFKSISTDIIDDSKSSESEFNKKKEKQSSFLAEKEYSTLRLDSTFNNHALYISKLNSFKKSWNAGLHSQFYHKSIAELNKFAGIPRVNSFRFKSIPIQEEDVSDLPLNFDWKDKLRSAGTQGNCGSCYAYSTVRMIEARLKIKYNHDVHLSVQHALDCSIYNQGCSGGYPYLVMKYAHDFELIPEYCKPYDEIDGLCNLENKCDIKKLPYLYKTADYKYIGGSYGQCSMRKMMEELLQNGPIVVSFEPDYNFMMYKSGIFHSLNEDDSWISKGLPKPEWEKVDHSVLLVGWGEEPVTKERFWIIQNTWGPQWGENGFFRMKRGTDEFGIESICEAATPVILESRTGRIIGEKESLQEVNKISKALLKQSISSDTITRGKAPSIFDIFT